MYPAELKTFRPPRYAGGKGVQKKRKPAYKPKNRCPLLGSPKPRLGGTEKKPKRLKTKRAGALKKNKKKTKKRGKHLKGTKNPPFAGKGKPGSRFSGNPKIPVGLGKEESLKTRLILLGLSLTKKEENLKSRGAAPRFNLSA